MFVESGVQHFRMYPEVSICQPVEWKGDCALCYTHHLLAVFRYCVMHSGEEQRAGPFVRSKLLASLQSVSRLGIRSGVSAFQKPGVSRDNGRRATILNGKPFDT